MILLLAFIVGDVLNHNEMAKKFSRYYGILFLYAFITFVNDQTFNHNDLTVYSLAVLALLAINPANSSKKLLAVFLVTSNL